MNLKIFLSICFAVVCASQLKADSLDSDVATLIESSCIGCHDAGTETQLNFEMLSDDLSDAASFRMWVRVLDRVVSGEMPPPSSERPDAAVLRTAADSVKMRLRSHNLAVQKKRGRVPARRLTKREYGYTIRDLLKIDADVTDYLPDESESSSFDTVGASQRLSAIHVEGYLKAADVALDHALQVGPNPYRVHAFDLHGSALLNDFHEKPLTLGGNVTRKLSEGVALFRDTDYLLQSGALGFGVPVAGNYKITATVEAFQATELIPYKLIVKRPSGGATLVEVADLKPDTPETIETIVFLNPGDVFYVTLESDEAKLGSLYASGAKNFAGPGLALRSWKVAGPMSKSWPPASAKQLRPDGNVATRERVQEVVGRMAPAVFRRPVSASEIAAFTNLASGAIEEGRDFDRAVRVPLRAMLTSSKFLMFNEQPGKLDDFALANRLSYFLWRSMPDDELLALASKASLSEPNTSADQVDRLLSDPKSKRFVSDFLGQWMRLYKVNATSPDEQLYPEFDEILGHAIVREPELFFSELVRENLSLRNLIDSDFTFVNRRLAEHYGINGVDDEQFRKVTIPDDVHRGGILTQAAVLKTTANGTVTSPVTRGNFVLTNFLGQPPSPPPPSVGSIEPDIRGKTTIREILATHRDNETCNQCHRMIDPPGFALESFDPIGNYRTRYRAVGPGLLAMFGGASYHAGPAVDASGVTAEGKPFDGIRQYKQRLLEQQDQVARNFVSQLVVYSTGGEIEFADREVVEEILSETKKDDYRVRDLIHAVVQSRLFREK